MIALEEEKEKEYLLRFLSQVDFRLSQVNTAIRDKKDEIDEMHQHLQEHKRDMDHLDKNAFREAIENQTLIGDHSVDTRKRLWRLKETAYFGRIDFIDEEKKDKKNIYIGVHNFQDTESQKNLVHDWRAPISSLFYDFELGEAFYDADKKQVRGVVDLKRQFKIRQGKMEYMLDTDVTIHDEVLQKELGQSSTHQMKNIVATIQKEQNAIIRDEDSRHLIIQGVAGSGKTSIALHRIAFLLYRFKETISSEDILIISPNKVFASYISNVLPELGEDTVAETSMEEIADELLDYQVSFQNFFEQVTELLEKNDTALIDRIKFKSSPELIKMMDKYLIYLENEGFNVSDILVKKKPIPAWFIRESFQRYSRMPLLKRFNEVVREIVENMKAFYNLDIQYKDRTDLHNVIRKMFPSYNIRILYKGFYEWMGKETWLKMKKNSQYEWSDVYALLYLKLKLEGLKTYSKVKHLVIDEMQDYSTVQYRLLSYLFPCKKTVLGDINQSVNPFSASNLETISRNFPNATTMTMLKSYRSTYEITTFTQQISPQVKVEAIERHGDIPQKIQLKSVSEEIKRLKNLITDFKSSPYNSLGVICKTQKQVEKLYDALKGDFSVQMLNAVSVALGSGIVITTAHLAKGLEFDQVIVPHCDSKNYTTEPDRQMLYVACTRAMHRLFLTYTGMISSFLIHNPEDYELSIV